MMLAIEIERIFTTSFRRKESSTALTRQVIFDHSWNYKICFPTQCDRCVFCSCFMMLHSIPKAVLSHCHPWGSYRCNRKINTFPLLLPIQRRRNEEAMWEMWEEMHNRPPKNCSKESQIEHLWVCCPCCISKEALIERILLAASAVLTAKLPIVQLSATTSHDITEK